MTEAVRNKNSLFSQCAAIIDETVNTGIDLPGKYKRRFFIEFMEDNRTKFGVVNFHVKMRFSEAVKAIKMMESKTLKVVNALYLDMGAVSEGYFYDRKGQRCLIGDPGKDMKKYTNLLVMYSD